MAAEARGFVVRSLTFADCEWILAKDQALYPPNLNNSTETALTAEKLWTWISLEPEFSFCFVDVDNAEERLGITLRVVVNEKGWNGMCAGLIKEETLTLTPSDTSNLFNWQDQTQNAVGLHGYHIERSNRFPRPKLGDLSFTELCFSKFGQALENLRRRRPDVQFLGVSSLAVTEDGRRTNEKMGLREIGYISTLYILTFPDGHRETIDSANQTDIPANAQALRCIHYIAKPGMPSRALELLGFK